MATENRGGDAGVHRKRRHARFILMGFAVVAVFLLLPWMRQRNVLSKTSYARISRLYDNLPSISSGLPLTYLTSASSMREENGTSSIPVESRTEDTGEDTDEGNHSNYKILGFSDEFYIDHAIHWFQELTQPPLSYPKQNVVVGAMSLSTLKSLQGRNISSQPCGFSLSNQLHSKPTNVRPQRRRRRLFAARWKCVLDELQKGIHVVLTDVDNYFTRHVPIVKTFGHWNVIHSYCYGFPVDLHAKHGFTVCGGMSWLQSHPATIQYIELLIQRCGNECDDQIVLNSLLLEETKVEWTVDPSSVVEHDPERILSQQNKPHLLVNHTTNKSTPTTHNWFEPYAARYGHSNVTALSISIWDREFAYRGPPDAHPCPRRFHNWVAMPFKQQGQTPSQLWERHCPSSSHANNSHR